MSKFDHILLIFQYPAKAIYINIDLWILFKGPYQFFSLQVKDLEAELETTKQKNKENLQQAILIERERLTQMQWDMEEMKRKSLEMELKLKSKKVVSALFSL